MKETIEHNNRFYGEELKTESEQYKEWLVIANKEIERLNNDFTTLKLLQQKHLEEIERLNSIIKEVREFIKDNAMYSEEEKICCDDLYSSDCDRVLKILDKVGSDKE